MRIFFNKSGFVDFEAPIYMDKQKQEKFILGMKEIFEDRIIIENVIENRKQMGKRKSNSKKFDVKALILLANGKLNREEIAAKLEKTPFAIKMKRGPFLMELISWAKKRNLSKLNEKDVKVFLKELGYGN